MATNAEIAASLALIAQMLELLEEDKFRIIAHVKAARAVEALPMEVGPLAAAADGKAKLMEFNGIGPRMADKIIEIEKTGKIKELEELKAKVPPGVTSLLRIPGMGPKTAACLWKEAGVVDVAGLKAAIENGKIKCVPRMGDKAIEKLKKSLELLDEGESRMRLGDAMPVAERVVAYMENVKGVTQVAYAGSLRRGKETIGDIDILVVAKDAAGATQAFCTMPGVRQITAQGETRCSVRLFSTKGTHRWVEADDSNAAAEMGPTVQVDLRVVPAGSWGAALMYFTGSKEHNVKLRERALKKGWTLTAYGLYPFDKEQDEGKAPPHERGVKPIAGKTEEEVYAKFGLPWIPPEMREDCGELDLKKVPPLVEVSDIKAELHAHTKASDGSMTIEQLVEAAKERGFHTIAVTDHSQSSAIAGGLKPDRLREHIKAVKAVGASVKGIKVLTGSEVDILVDGRLDYDDALLAELDIVVASPHGGLGQDPETATKRLVRAASHPLVHIMGHPTGRLVMRRAGMSPDMGAVIAAAKKNNVALEINAHWHRLDLRDTHVRAAVEAGCLIAINCDVHARDEFENIRYGVLTGRRGWLPKELCINCWPAEKLHKWIAGKRK